MKKDKDVKNDPSGPVSGELLFPLQTFLLLERLKLFKRVGYLEIFPETKLTGASLANIAFSEYFTFTASGPGYKLNFHIGPGSR